MLTESSKLRVVHVTTSHAASDVRVFERECKSLASTPEFRVHLAAAGSLPAGSSVIHLPLPERPARRLRRFIEGPRDAWRLSRTQEFDIWHFHDPELLPIAIWLARRGRRVVWDAHEDYCDQLTGRGTKKWVPAPFRSTVRLGMSAMLREADRQVSAVVAATPTIAARYRNRRTVVVGNEARISDFEGCSPTAATRQVLFTGSLTDDQCFSELVSAVESLQDVRLLVAGRPPSTDLWNAAERRLGRRLRHAGWLDRSGLATAISESSIGAVLYSDSPEHASNLGNKFFEFAAAGLPIVGTPTASNRELITQSRSGSLAADFNAAALAEAISKILADELEWQSYSRAGRQWASSNGSWAASEARLIGLYRDIVNQGAR